jgi:PB1 domain
MNSERSRIGSIASTRTGFSDTRSPQSNFGQPELYDDVYDMYNSRGRQARPGAARAQTGPGAPPSTQGYISEEEEDLTASSIGGYDEPDFEMMVARSATGRSSRKSRSSNNGSMVMPMLPEQQFGPPPDIKRIRVKVHAEDSRYVIVTPAVQFADFVASIRNKFGLATSFKVKMSDDGDMITMSDQDDLDMAIDISREQARQTRSEMGKMEVSCSFLCNMC